MNMYKTILTSEALRMEDLDRALKKAGFQPLPLGQTVPRDVVGDVLDSNPEHRHLVESGRVDFVPTDYRVYRNGEDTVKAVDYELRQPTRTTNDPVIIIEESVPGRTSGIVKEILLKELTIDSIKFSISRGVHSTEVITCLKEISLLTGESFEKLYSKHRERTAHVWAELARRQARPTIASSEQSARGGYVW